MLPKSILLALTSEGRAGAAPVDENRRNVAATAASRPSPLPAREIARARFRHAAPGSDVRAIHPAREDGKVRVRRCWSGAIIELLGEHDLATAMRVEDCLRDLLADGSVVVDLSAAALIDCSILHALAAASLNGAHDMVVCAPPGTCPRRLIDVVASSNDLGLTVYDTRGEALHAVALWAS